MDDDDILAGLGQEQLKHLVNLSQMRVKELEGHLDIAHKTNSHTETKLKGLRGQNTMLSDKIAKLEERHDEQKGETKKAQTEASVEKEWRIIEKYEIMRAQREKQLMEEEVKQVRKSAKALNDILEYEKNSSKTESSGLRTALKCSTKIQTQMDRQFETYNKKIAELELEIITIKKALEHSEEVADGWEKRCINTSRKLKSTEAELMRIQSRRGNQSQRHQRQVVQAQDTHIKPQTKSTRKKRQSKQSAAAKRMDSNGHTLSEVPSLSQVAKSTRPDIFPPKPHTRYEWAAEEEGGGIKRQQQQQQQSPQQRGGASLLQQALGLQPQQMQAAEYRIEDSAMFNDDDSFLPDAPKKQTKKEYEDWHKKKALPYEVYQHGKLPALDSSGCHPLSAYSGIYKGMNPMDV
jgi:chromosome segregation ATPase